MTPILGVGLILVMFLRPYTLKRNIVKGGQQQPQPNAGDIEAGGNGAQIAKVDAVDVSASGDDAQIPPAESRRSIEKTSPEEDVEDDAATAHGRENSTKEKGDVETIV
ncbi:hypothetical protein QCA50_003107 [Cerrena zonata]|uniref:Uncharacterized protein n=1 Tax=Cerrena zonata TaxID=2478898 RepID=A0AAW0GIQ5_9APHY